MKRVVMVIALVGLSPAYAQNQSQRGLAEPAKLTVEQRLAQLERLFDANSAKPCKLDAVNFGCHTVKEKK